MTEESPAVTRKASNSPQSVIGGQVIVEGDGDDVVSVWVNHNKAQGSPSSIYARSPALRQRRPTAVVEPPDEEAANKSESKNDTDGAGKKGDGDKEDGEEDKEEVLEEALPLSIFSLMFTSEHTQQGSRLCIGGVLYSSRHCVCRPT